MKMGNNKTLNIKPAQRLDFVQEYYFSRKLKEVAQLVSEGNDIISLAIGSPDLPPSANTIAKLCEVAQREDTHGYQPTKGTPQLLEAMATHYKRWYGVDVNPQNEVMPLIGSKEGILHITLAFANVGDKVLVPNPGYPTYTALSRLLGVEVLNYNLREENQWQPNFDELNDMDLSGVKLLWTNYPHMPTGGKPMMKTYERLVEFAQTHNIVVVNDNPYSLILTNKPRSIMQVDGAKDCCIELNSLSKSHNMPGWRVGMCVTNATWVQWMLKVKTNIDSGTFRGIQLAAAEAITGNTTEWHTYYNKEVYQRRRVIAEKIMKAIGCTFAPQQTGLFLWGKIPDSTTDAEQFTEHLLHQHGIFVAPGFIFGSNGKRYVRLSLCANEARMQEALQRITSKQDNKPIIEQQNS